MSTHNIGFYEEMSIIISFYYHFHLLLDTRFQTLVAAMPFLGNTGLFLAIMLTCPYNVYPLTPHFYIVKLGCIGVFIFSYFCSKT